MQSLQEIKNYTLPKLCTGNEWYIYFHAFNPITGKLQRKRIKINSIKNITERRRYAKDLMHRITEQLILGWNPWIEAENSNSYLLFSDVIDKYRRNAEKMVKDGLYREETYACYLSYIRNLENWNKSQKVPITYIYQFNRDFCVRFLEDMYIGRDNTAFTRDNYLAWLQTFGRFCTNNNYLKNNPTEGISSIGKRGKKKMRTSLSQNDLDKLIGYLNTKNKYYLLACYVLYYCFIRPKEMSYLKFSNFSIKRQTVFVPDEISKNKKDGTITLPTKVIKLMLELNIFENPSEYYLFSEGFAPGENRKSEKQFRDFWSSRIRKDLKFPEKYKFYSLKDTGITNMLRHYDTLSVRDQARHSSILMTDIYTPHDIQEANDLIKNYDGDF